MRISVLLSVIRLSEAHKIQTYLISIMLKVYEILMYL